MKKVFIYISGRLIRFFGNVMKFFFYIFHFLFPKKRFSLPETAQPLSNERVDSVIPRIIWQTNYTGRVTLPVYVNYLFNRMMAPGYVYRFMDTEAREVFVRDNYSQEILDNYLKLQIGAAQADFWRLLVLYKLGGVYFDIDAYAVWPLASIIRPELDELYIVNKRGELTNYFIASKPGNPHLLAMIDIVMNNINENTITNVYEMTGPGVFNRVLDPALVSTSYYRYTCNQGGFTNEYFQYVDKPQGKWNH